MWGCSGVHDLLCTQPTGESLSGVRGPSAVLSVTSVPSDTRGHCGHQGCGSFLAWGARPGYSTEDAKTMYILVFSGAFWAHACLETWPG